ncbi:MAG: conserved rane protein of unknown function [Deltaproteobacteria bacterium]|nr:conserved rane protein of unknown function [Deltaproteobacteria bacterium]
MIRHAQRLLLLFGIALCVLLVAQVGVAQICRDLRLMGWSLLGLVLLEVGVDALNTIGWRYTFPIEERCVPFGSLFLARLAGTAFNQILPAATVGGEPVKALLLRAHLPISSTLASVVTGKLTYSVAQAAFAFAGVLFAFQAFALPVGLRRGLLASLALTVVGIGFFLWLQRRGLFATAATVTQRLGLPDSWGDAIEHATHLLDDRVRDFHVDRPLDFVLSVGCHLAGLLVGVLQVYLLLSWLGLPAGFATCFTIEALAVLIQAAAFLVPGSIGVQEGGKVMIFSALGLPPAAGLSVGLAFRLNQVVGIALGLAAYAVLHWRQPPGVDPQASLLAPRHSQPASIEPKPSAPLP